MILCDTGPIVALLNRNDPSHESCVNIAGRLPRSFITTQACVTEAMYLLYRDTGYLGISFLWQMIEKGALRIGTTGPEAMQVIHRLMEQYRDLPCDYADSTLVALAEDISIRCVFTIDPHFYAYRLTNGKALTVISPDGR